MVIAIALIGLSQYITYVLRIKPTITVYIIVISLKFTFMTTLSVLTGIALLLISKKELNLLAQQPPCSEDNEPIQIKDT